MSKTWKVDHWDVPIKAARGMDRKGWRQLAIEEEEDMEARASVFVITSDWTPDGDGIACSEIVGDKFFFHEESAWRALYEIAEAYDVRLLPDEDVFISPDQSETYYIKELFGEQV